MNRKRIGILLVVLAILIGGIAVFTFFVNDQEPKKEKTKVEKETEKEIVTLPEQEEAPEETEEPEEPEGAPEKNVYIEQVQMDLIGLSEETEASIPDREAFDYQIKEWLYEHDKDQETIQSLNTVTYYYDQNVANLCCRRKIIKCFVSGRI